MALDLSTMRTAVRTRLGSPATDGFFSDAQLNDLINEGLQAYATEHDWPWLEATETLTTSAGSAALSPSGTWTRTKGLIIDGYDALEMVSLAELRGVPTTIRGVPRVYCIEQEAILLRPVPNAAYSVTHDYYKVEPELVGDANQPLLPSQFRYAIIEYATYLAHLRAGQPGPAQAALSAYSQWIQRMRDNRRRSTSTIKVRVRPGGAL